MKNILVLGGSYFAGRIFVEELIKGNMYQIYVCNRGRVPLGFPEIKELVCDRQDVRGLRRVVPELEWDALVDFCAYSPEDLSRIFYYLPGRIRQYIFISTTSVYEDNPSWPLEENATKVSTAKPDLGFFADYGLKKWRAEELLTAEAGRHDLAYTILRPAMIYGPYNYAKRETYFFDALVANQPLIVPDTEPTFYSFCWAVDLARIIIACLGREEAFEQVFNVAGPEQVSYWRFVEMIHTITGKTMLLDKMSLEEIEARSIPLPFPSDRHLLYSGEKLAGALDFEYTPMLLGLRRTLEYYIMVRRKMKETEERKIKSQNLAEGCTKVSGH